MCEHLCLDRDFEKDKQDDECTCMLLFSFPLVYQSVFSSSILRKLFSLESVVITSVGGEWNMAIEGSNRGVGLEECILKVVWKLVVQNQS